MQFETNVELKFQVEADTEEAATALSAMAIAKIDQAEAVSSVQLSQPRISLCGQDSVDPNSSQAVATNRKFKTKSALPWFGSDASVAAELGARLDDCKHVTIPFAGGMSILPHLKAKGIVANDLHKLAVNFYDVLCGRRGEKFQLELLSMCNNTLSHPDHLSDATSWANCELATKDPVEVAWGFWAQCWIGRKGKGGTKNQGGKASVRRTASGGNNATRLRSAAADLEAWAEEFKQRCEFTCEDFRECITKIADDPKCGVYVDPPWFGAGRNYLHSFKPEDHEDLRDNLDRFHVAKVVVRYGDCAEVRVLYDDPRWRIHDATSRTQANRPLGELWITNFEVKNEQV